MKKIIMISVLLMSVFMVSLAKTKKQSLEGNIGYMNYKNNPENKENTIKNTPLDSYIFRKTIKVAK